MSFDEFCKLIQNKQNLKVAESLLIDLKLKLKPQIIINNLFVKWIRTNFLLHEDNDKNLIIFYVKLL